MPFSIYLEDTERAFFSLPLQSMHKKILLGVTAAGSSRLLDGQVSYFVQKGYQVYLCSPDHEKEHRFCARENAIHVPIRMEKEISPLTDLRSLTQLLKAFAQIKPDVVNVGTPKMGLLGTMAAWILRLPIRIYTCRGLRYENEHGFKKWILQKMERLSCLLATDVIYVSPSVMQTSMANGTCILSKSKVLGSGSSNGVDLHRFSCHAIPPQLREDLRAGLKLQGCFVIGNVGRVSEKKGCKELIDVFENLHKTFPHVRLLLVGHIHIEATYQEKIQTHPAIIHIPFTDEVPSYMALMDLFVFPSWQEGFPNVLIQAAAMGLPIIASDATGVRDALHHGFNGEMVPTKNPEALQEAMQRFYRDSVLRTHYANHGPLWAQNFKNEIIWSALEEFYIKKMNATLTKNDYL